MGTNIFQIVFDYAIFSIVIWYLVCLSKEISDMLQVTVPSVSANNL